MKTQRKRLNDVLVKRLRSMNDRVEVKDTEIVGLSVICNLDGSRKFWFRYTSPVGRGKPRLALGHYAGDHPDELRCEDCLTVKEARTIAFKYRSMVVRGEDPKAPRKAPTEKTFKEVAEGYLEDVKNRSSIVEIRRIAKVSVRTELEDGRLLGEVPISAVDVDQILQVLEPIRQRAPVMANRTYSILGAIMAYGIRTRVVKTNPVRALPRPSKEKERERFLADTEIQSIWPFWSGKDLPRQYARDWTEDTFAGSFFRLALLTGARRKEILMMEWNKVDFEKDLWTIPARTKVLGKSVQVSKNGHQHILPLTPLSKSIIQGLKPFASSNRWVFPQLRSEKDVPRTSIQKAKERYRLAAAVPQFQTRDLRATMATGLAGLGIDDVVTGAVLNHKPPGMTARVYIRLKARRLPEIKTALHQWDEHIRSLVAEPSL